MDSSNNNRREFLKKAGLGAAAAMMLGTHKIIGKTNNGYLVESEEEYGDFLVEKLSEGKYPYQANPDVLTRMHEKMTVFSRNGWDPVRANRPEALENLTEIRQVQEKGILPNFNRLDYALKAASWGTAHFYRSPFYNWEPATYMVKGMTKDKLGSWDPITMDMNWDEATLAVKHASLFLGASMAGIAELNPLWLYDEIHSPTRENRERTIPFIIHDEKFGQEEDAWYISKSMNKVIALGFEEDYDAIMNSPGQLASAAVGDGYSRMAVTAHKVAEFIRALGYNALPAGNGVGLSVPMAIDAGFGELGRNGLLITPKYGPRIRLAKVITDMPLIPDSPISFGVKEFCEACMTCADDCPSGSITRSGMKWEGTNVSNNSGVEKWYVEPETCYDYNGFSCSNCKRNCPFNKPNNSWLHKVIREAIKLRSVGLGKAMVTLDQASGYGQQLEDTEFWKKDGSASITAREKM